MKEVLKDKNRLCEMATPDCNSCPFLKIVEAGALVVALNAGTLNLDHK